MPEELTLDQVAEMLERYRVRATYGAVAGYLRLISRSLMQDIERSPRNSWIVNKETSQPTDYAPEELHPDLNRHSMVLADERELREWLRRKVAKGPRAGSG